MAKTTLAEAAALEAEAEKYPDERAELLLEAATAWRHAGGVDRARELLAGLVEEGGPEGCWARVELAETYFDEGASDRAYAELARLAREPALDDGHCTLVGELLSEREDFEGALAWFDRGVARLSSDQLDALDGPDGWFAFAAGLVRQRREVRERLGLPPDATDELVPERPPAGPVDLEDVRDRIDAGEVATQLRVVVFQRDQRAVARKRWPEDYPGEDDEYYLATERGWRDLAERGVPSIRVVPAKVTGLVAVADRLGAPATDPAVKAEYGQMFDERDLIVWPPARNGPCWCGSGGKYKKCCGRILAQ